MRKGETMLPTVVIRNRTAASASVNLFDPYDPSVNATTTYRYDITSELFNNKDRVSIQYKAVNALNYSVSVVALAASNATSVITALNGLGVGTFYLVQTGGNMYIQVQSDTLQYNTLDIYRQNNSAPVFGNLPASYRINDSQTAQIILAATDPDLDNITFSVTGLPSFCTLTQFSFANNWICAIEAAPGGAADDGTYNMAVIATDSEGASTSKAVSLVVDSGSYFNFTRPYTDTRSIAVGDFSQQWNYDCGLGLASGTTSYSSPTLGWSLGYLAIPPGYVAIFPHPIVSNTGDHILIVAIHNSNSTEYQDSFFVKITVTP